MLGWIAFAWIVGLVFGSWSGGQGGVVLAIVALLGAAPLVWFGGVVSARLWVVPLAGLASCAGLGMTQAPVPPCAARGDIDARAVVERMRFGAEEADSWLRVIDGWWRTPRARLPPGMRLRLRTSFEEAPPQGSTVSFRGHVRPPTVLRNLSIKPAAMSRRDEACWAVGHVDVVAERPIATWLARVRRNVRRRFANGLPDDTSSVARALVLGDGAALPYERRRTIAAVGLAHLFAVSGLHIALVSGTLVRATEWALRGWCIGIAPVRVAAAIGVPLTLLHATFAGGAPSAWRAAITAALTWGFVALGRKASPLSVMGAAALVLSAPDPTLATRPAFLLSVAATAAILGGAHVTPGRWRRLRSASTVSLRTLVATAPMVWWWFGGVPLIGWLSNILVLPLGSLAVIPLAHLYALFSGVPFVETWLASGLTKAVRLLLGACDLLAPFTVAQQLPPLDTAQGVIVAIACGLLLVTRHWKTRVCIVACATLAWGVAEHRIRDRAAPLGVLRITQLDVGQGDAALVDFPDGSIGLIDTGRGGRHPAGRALIQLLRERRRTRLDRVIITHGHPDHDGALPQLIDAVEIGELWLNGQKLAEERDGAFGAWLEDARSRGVEVRFVEALCGQPHALGGARVDVLWPCPRYDPALDFNDNSITLLVSYGKRRVLFTGDLEAAAEAQLLEAGAIGPIDVLKVGHHGSKTSSTASFVDAVNPAVALISAGKQNRYGHPNAGVIARLRATGAHVFRTDIQGGVEVETDGDALTARSWRGETWPPSTAP